MFNTNKNKFLDDAYINGYDDAKLSYEGKAYPKRKFVSDEDHFAYTEGWENWESEWDK